MSDFPNTHHERIEYGKHQGERFTRLPLSYLRWMVKERSRQHELAAAELSRRGKGLTDSDIEISGHAIDRASLYLWAEYRHNHKPNEGLHAWLERVVGEAIDQCGRQEYVTWEGRVKFVLEVERLYVTVKTCMLNENRGR